MTDWINTHYQTLQAWPLFTMGCVMMIFGFAVIAAQIRANIKPRLWGMPGGWVGGIFLVVKGCLPMHMALSRFGILPWEISSWQATIIYTVISFNAIATFLRWWRHGFEDIHSTGAWDGTERRSGLDRRKAQA